MNLKRLFEIQKQLDDGIVEQHDLQNENLLPERILALQVELGECADEWRGFKFWSNDKEPRTDIETGVCVHCAGTGNAFYDDEEAENEDCRYCDGSGDEIVNPLLEEYVDVLHFVLSVGIHTAQTPMKADPKFQGGDVIGQFKEIAMSANAYEMDFVDQPSQAIPKMYAHLIENFLGLGEMLGFTEQQIEQAYLDKNNVNHDRQNNGY